MSTFAQGVQVTIAGMGLVFAALGLLMLIIAGLERVFREHPTAAPAAPRPAAPAPAVPNGEEEEVSAQVAVSIAVALAQWQRQRQVPSSPETTVVTFSPGSGAWRATGRLS